MYLVYYSNVFANPTMHIDKMIVAIPAIIAVYVGLLTPFHSFKAIPQAFEIKIINAMCNIQELAPLPNLLSPMP